MDGADGVEGTPWRVACIGDAMPDPFWLIVGFIAIACVLLFPLRMWMLSRRRATDDEAGGDPVPLAPPERRNRG